MTPHRFFLTSELPAQAAAGDRVTLPLDSGDVRHITRALRLGAGDVIVVAEQGGAAWTVRIDSAGGPGLVATLLETVEIWRPPELTLVFALAKGAKPDLVVEKAVEIGVSRIVPVITERSVVRLTAEKAVERGERWRRVARAAAKQSHRDAVPPVADPAPIAGVAEDVLASHDIVLVAWEDAAATAPGIGSALDEAGARAGSRVAVVVGPEGGLTAAEVYGLERGGARTVSLGATVLRAETAAVIAAGIALYELGALGGRERC